MTRNVELLLKDVKEILLIINQFNNQLMNLVNVKDDARKDKIYDRIIRLRNLEITLNERIERINTR